MGIIYKAKIKLNENIDKMNRMNTEIWCRIYLKLILRK